MSISFGSWKVLEAKRVVMYIGLWGLEDFCLDGLDECIVIRNWLVPISGIIEQFREHWGRSRHVGRASEGECSALLTPFKTTLFRFRRRTKL